jgi:predicted phage gp36 major capsid-like protein
MEPTTAEIARDLRQLEARIDRERVELLDEVRRGFANLKTAIDNQSAERITKDVYRAEQRRFEADLASLRKDVAMIKRMFVGGFLSVIAASVVVQMMMVG